MKRILTIAAALTAAASMVLPASAASTYTYGSVKLQWNVPLTATLVMHSNYNAAGAFAGASNTLLPSSAGVCTSQAAGETDLNLNFGNQAVSAVAGIACTYKNAVAMSLTTNAKYTVNEYLDTAGEVPAHTGFCAYPNGGAFGGTGTAAATQSARGADPGVGTFNAGGTLTACAAGGSVIPIAAGAISNAGAAPVAFPGSAGGAYTGEYVALGAPALALITNASPPAGTVWMGEDIQLALDANAPATGAATSAFMTVQLVSN